MSAVLAKRKYVHVFEDRDDGQAEIRANVARVFAGRPCRRVLLVAVPQIARDAFQLEHARLRRYPLFPPYGPALLVRILEEAGYAADVLDLGFEIMESACGGGAFSYDVWRERLSERVWSFRPDVVGLSCMFNMGHEPLKAAARFVKARGIPVIAGGVHVSLTTDQLLADVPEVDFALLYEADRSLLGFLEAANGDPEAELSQVATMVDGRVVKLAKRATPEELLHEPDYKALPIERYALAGKIGAYTFLRPDDQPSATVLSARGCRAACGFCSVRSVNGVGVRVRGVEQVADEVERLRDRYGVRHVMWLDDDLFYDRERAQALFEELARRRLGVTWDASNGIIAASLTPELIRACVASGCVGFNIGVESGNAEMLRMMKKPGTPDTFRKAAALLREAPEIFTKGFLMLGFPGETVGAMRDTVGLAVEMGLDWYPIQILTPMPGTPIFQMMADQGLLGDIPTTVLGKARTFAVGATGSLGRREGAEKLEARPFRDLLAGDQARVPERAEMEDLWLAIDYRANYEPILGMADVGRLRKKRAMLREICARMTSENALGTLFLAETEERLGDRARGSELRAEAASYLAGSAFWRARFAALGVPAITGTSKTCLAA